MNKAMGCLALLFGLALLALTIYLEHLFAAAGICR